MVKLTRRYILRQGTGLFLTLTPVGTALAKPVPSAQLLVIRIWPANAYTRVILESNHSMKYQHLMLDNPNRLVVDIQGAEINSILQDISSKVLSDDPPIRSIRTGQNTPSTVRIVINLKQSTHPQVLALAPIGDFRNRPVIGLYPYGANANDPMMALFNGSVPKQCPNINTAYDTPAPKSSRGSGGNHRPAITLDPGYGDEDSGAIGPSGLKEKNIALPTTRETKKRLEALGYNVFMTCNEDIFIPLGICVTKSRAHNADIFVSVHVDALISPPTRGTGVYMLNTKGTTSSMAKFLVRTQNNANAIGDIQTSGDRNVDNTILDMTQTVTLCDSCKLGHLVLIELSKLNQLHKGRVDEASFAVLRVPDIPSILVETAFLSNLIEEWLPGSELLRQQCAQATASDIQKYINIAILRRG